MATEIQKLQDLEYDELIALLVIQNDEDLASIISQETNLSFNVLISLSKENKLSEETKTLIEEVFEKIILTKADLISKYNRIKDSSTQIPINSPTMDDSIDLVKKPLKKEKSLPRRFGKDKIEEAIKSQGGKATNVQLAALAVNDLKNIWCNLNTRLINDMLTDSPILSDEDYREITASILILKRKFKEILKKKTKINEKH